MISLIEEASLFLDFPSSLVLDEERQDRQYDEGGEDGEKQDEQGAGVEPQELQNGEGGEDGEKQEGQGGTRSEKCAGRKNALPLESKATQGESDGSIAGEERSEGVCMSV